MRSQDKDVITERKDSHSQIAQAAVWVVWAVSDFNRRLIVCIGFLCVTLYMQAQYVPQGMSLHQGEEVTYDVYLKWGILMPRAGEARITFNKSSLKGQPTSLYRMVFQTANIFESIFKMRDTINCYYSPNNTLLYSLKHTVEGGYDLTDALTFSYAGKETSVHSFRYTPTATKIDTTLMVTSGHAFDMLGATFFLRTLDIGKMKVGESFPFTVAVGKDLVKTNYQYQGQAIVERNNVKYRTHHFMMDIQDEAFSQRKASAEVWVGDDENHVVIKIRTKLIIGYAEVHYKSSNNLKAPLDCRVELQKKK